MNWRDFWYDLGLFTTAVVFVLFLLWEVASLEQVR